jgi:uncharacterized membrane protein
VAARLADRERGVRPRRQRVLVAVEPEDPLAREDVDRLRVGLVVVVRPRARAGIEVADIAQQVVGGFLLAGPFVVTAEVWELAYNMNLLQGAVTVLIVGTIGYSALYGADDDRDPDREDDVLGIPYRFLSLMSVAFGSVLVLALVFGAPATFFSLMDVPAAEWPIHTAKAVAIGGIFAVVGAATADSLF